MRVHAEAIALVLAVAVQSTSLGQNVAVDHATLRKALNGITPQDTDYGLSGTFVRTIYVPQPIGGASTSTDRVQRTLISEILVNASCVQESLCDARLAQDAVKQYAYHYAKNARDVMVYDSRNKVGTIRQRPKTETNILGLLLSPDAATNSGRFISRSMPVLVSKLAGATVTEETHCVTSEGDGVELMGRYGTDADPARRFRMAILPQRNYAIAELTEYDSEGRILTEMSASGFRRVDGCWDLWLPRQTELKAYRRDDYEGATSQLFRLDILEPKVLAVRQDDFALAFPSDALKVRRIEHRGDPLGHMDDILDDTFDSIVGDIVANLSDDKGEGMVERTRAAYAREEGTPTVPARSGEPVEEEDTTGGTVVHARGLVLPEGNRKRLLIGIVSVCGITLLAASGVYMWLLRIRARGARSSSQER